MLDIKYIRENAEAVKKNCELGNIKCDIDQLLALDEKRRETLQFIEELKAEKNKINEAMKESGDGEEKKELIDHWHT